jgi:hypothetical protein
VLAVADGCPSPESNPERLGRPAGMLPSVVLGKIRSIRQRGCTSWSVRLGRGCLKGARRQQRHVGSSWRPANDCLTLDYAAAFQMYR